MTLPSETPHAIEIRHDPQGGFCANCACGWSFAAGARDGYVQASDTQRAIEVHLRRPISEEFAELIARSSIGSALADIKLRGIEAHLVDLEREFHPRRRVKKPARKKQESP